RRRGVAGRDRAPRAVRRQPRRDVHRHQGAARGRPAARRRRVGRGEQRGRFPVGRHGPLRHPPDLHPVHARGHRGARPARRPGADHLLPLGPRRAGVAADDPGRAGRHARAGGPGAVHGGGLGLDHGGARARVVTPAVPQLPGLDPRWSRFVTVPGAGEDPPARWHLLDNTPDLGTEVHGTLLAVHGNPTWSYLWRSLLPAAADAGWRVVAVARRASDRTHPDGGTRRLTDWGVIRVVLTVALVLRGSAVIFGHDCGGVFSLGCAFERFNLLAGVVLTNSAVHPADVLALPA